MDIRIEKLETPILEGDWHDAPLKWRVVGPGNEVQNFFVKANALKYMRNRKNSKSFVEASRLYCGKAVK